MRRTRQTLSASDAPLALVARRVLGPRAGVVLTVIALGATANTVLLVLVSASRSLHGMAAAGTLPTQLGCVTRRGSPAAATWLVVAVIALVVAVETPAQTAFMTDALVLTSFMAVDAILIWLAARRRLDGGAGRRAADMTLGSLAFMGCGWLLVHVGWPGQLAAGAFGRDRRRHRRVPAVDGRTARTLNTESDHDDHGLDSPPDLRGEA
jgi:amino acid transporter